MLLCIGNTNRRTCKICDKLVKAGFIKSITELDHHHEMHKENPSFRPTRVGLSVCRFKFDSMCKMSLPSCFLTFLRKHHKQILEKFITLNTEGLVEEKLKD